MADVGSIRAGRAFVELVTEDSKLGQGLRAAQDKLKAFGEGLKTVGKNLGMVGAAIVAPMIAGVKSFMDVAGQLRGMSARTGIGVEQLSAMGYAAKRTGVDMELLEIGIRKMERTIGQAINGSKAAQESLARLGLTVQALAGLSPDQQFKLIADRIGAIHDPTLRAAAAMDIFGRSGTSLIPMMARGSKGIEELEARARALGLTMSVEEVTAAKQFGLTMKDLSAVFQRLKDAIGAAVIPVLQGYSQALIRVTASVLQLAKQHQFLVATVFSVGTAFVALGATSWTMGLVITKLSGVFGALLIVIKAVRTASLALWAVMAADPVIALMVGSLAGLTALVNILYIANRKTAELTDAMAKLREEGDHLRQSDGAQVAQLQKLVEKHTVNREEMIQAEKIIAALEGRYGSFGVTVDETTGTITAAGNAFGRLAAAMAELAIFQLDDEIREAQKNIRELTEEIASAIYRAEWDPFSSEKARIDDVNAALGKQIEQYKRIQEAKGRINRIQGGEHGAVTGEGPAIPGVAPEAAGAGKDKTPVYREDWARKIHQLEIEMIEDEERRQIAAVNERYDYEFRKASEANANTHTYVQIAIARNLETEKVRQQFARQRADNEERMLHELEMIRIGGIQDEYQREVAAINARYDFETRLAERKQDWRAAEILDQQRAAELAQAAAREKLRADEKAREIARSNKAVSDDIEESKLRAKLKGRELDTALLELQRRRAIEEARAAGANVALVKEQFEWRRRILDMQAGMEQARVTVAGSFNATAAWRAFSAGDMGNEIARNTRETNRLLGQLVRHVNPLVFQP